LVASHDVGGVGAERWQRPELLPKQCTEWHEEERDQRKKDRDHKQ
jgi:hypothetical protein